MPLIEWKRGRTHAVSPDVLDAILSPYKAHCRYLQSATIEVPERRARPGLGNGNGRGHGRGDPATPPVVLAHGEFQIPESWYIRDTGHFNSIEFNICYNQLVYTLIGQCVLNGLVSDLSSMTFDEYLARQLPDVLIAKFSSAFKRPMDSRDFRGTVSLNGITSRPRLMLLRTSCSFEGSDGGYSEGDITLTIVQRDPIRGRGPGDGRGPGVDPGA
jgi:hypothetical protein